MGSRQFLPLVHFIVGWFIEGILALGARPSAAKLFNLVDLPRVIRLRSSDPRGERQLIAEAAEHFGIERVLLAATRDDVNNAVLVAVLYAPDLTLPYGQVVDHPGS